jgi:hypothetical protein
MPVESTLLSDDRVATLWTLRDGKHNSFPYIKLKRPLLSVPADRTWRSAWSEKWKQLSSIGDRRRELFALAKSFPVADADWSTWPGPGLKDSLVKRVEILSKSGNETCVIRALIERFLRAAAEPATFVRKLKECLLDDLTEADTDLVALIGTALAGKLSGHKVEGAPLYIEVGRHEFADDAASQAEAGRIGMALTSGGAARSVGKCDVTGAERPLHVGNFPQPSLPVLGQFYLFAMNGDIRAAHRYGLADDRAIHVDALLVQRLAGALDEITAKHLKGKTWRSVPSEKPSKGDLFLAFVHQAPEAPLADMMAYGDDESLNLDDTDASGLDKATFIARAERVSMPSGPKSVPTFVGLQSLFAF